MNDDLLLEYLEQIITEILTTVDSTNWLDDAAGQQSLQTIYNLLDQFGVEVQQVLPFQVILQYFGGVDDATSALIEAGEEIAPTLAITDEGLIAAPFQKVIHTNAVEKIVDDTMGDMSAAIATAKASAAGAIGSTLAAVKSDIAKGMIKGDPWKVTQQAVMESFLKDGMTSFRVEDKNGVVRHLPLRFYAMTVVRTKRREASVQGSMNRYVDAGQDLTIITGNGDSCEICARFNGMVVSMTGKTEGFPALGENGIKLGPYHPNCRCGHRVFMMKFATDEEIKAAKARNKEYKPTGDPRTPEEKAAYEEEQRKRRVANAEAKQFARWQNVLGAEAPKTIGAFRTMKRKNSPKFQELQSAYLSATHTKMASPEQIKAADDAAIAKKKAAEEAEWKAKEAEEAAKLAKKQAALKKAQAEQKEKKAKEAAEAKAKAEAEEKAKKAAAEKKAKAEAKAAKEVADKAAAAAATAAKTADAADATAKRTGLSARIAEEAAKRKRRAAGLGSPDTGPRVVANDVQELADTIKQGTDLEMEIMEDLKKRFKDMPELPKRIEELDKMRDRWMVTSVRGSSAVVQDWYSDKLGSGFDPLASELHHSEFQVHPDLAILMEAQADGVKKTLKDKGYTHIEIYRGVKVYEDKVPDWFPQNYDENGRTAVNDNRHGRALTSWSFDPAIAKGFARGADRGALQKTQIPIDQIWGVFGFGSEREIVPMGLIEDVDTISMSEGLKKMLGDPPWAKDLKNPFDMEYPLIFGPGEE